MQRFNTIAGAWSWRSSARKSRTQRRDAVVYGHTRWEAAEATRRELASLCAERDLLAARLGEGVGSDYSRPTEANSPPQSPVLDLVLNALRSTTARRTVRYRPVFRGADIQRRLTRGLLSVPRREFFFKAR